jgi:hypothetical protein
MVYRDSEKRFCWEVKSTFIRAFLLILVLVLPHVSRGTADDMLMEEVEGAGRSPDRQMEVVNIHDGNGGYFVIHDSSGAIIFSEKSFSDEFPYARFAWKALWSPDSRFVAIAFGTSKFSVETIVFHRDGKTLNRVLLLPYDEDSDNTRRIPHQWRKNGDLVLDITEGYHTKSDGGISGYFATVHFTGNPPRASKGSETKPTDRD